MSHTYTRPFESISARDLPRVGGKGANLGALTSAGVPVPPGFCVTTAAFDEFLRALPGLDREFDRLDALDDRAVLYRAKNGFGHRGVRLAVVVQRLIDPDVSGILFTADPVSGRRDVV